MKNTDFGFTYSKISEDNYLVDFGLDRQFNCSKAYYLKPFSKTLVLRTLNGEWIYCSKLQEGERLSNNLVIEQGVLCEEEADYPDIEGFWDLTIDEQVEQGAKLNYNIKPIDSDSFLNLLIEHRDCTSKNLTGVYNAFFEKNELKRSFDRAFNLVSLFPVEN